MKYFATILEIYLLGQKQKAVEAIAAWYTLILADWKSQAEKWITPNFQTNMNRNETQNY